MWRSISHPGIMEIPPSWGPRQLKKKKKKGLHYFVFLPASGLWFVDYPEPSRYIIDRKGNQKTLSSAQRLVSSQMIILTLVYFARAFHCPIVSCKWLVETWRRQILFLQHFGHSHFVIAFYQTEMDGPNTSYTFLCKYSIKETRIFVLHKVTTKPADPTYALNHYTNSQRILQFIHNYFNLVPPPLLTYFELVRYNISGSVCTSSRTLGGECWRSCTFASANARAVNSSIP